MTAPSAEQRDETPPQTIEVPATATTQRALHEAVGHLYDELAVAREAGEDGTALPDDLFDQLESLYVATGEESLSELEISYERADAERR